MKILFMKKIFCILCILFYQNINAQSLIDSLSSLRFSMNDSVGEKLAELAMNNPSLKVIDEQIEASKYEWGIQKAGWLNNLNASFNLNEGNLRSSATPTDAIGFYPRYNFNLSVPLGNFFTRPKQANKARSQYEETMALKEVEKNEIRQSVLVVYQNYKMNSYLLALQEAAIQDDRTVFDMAEEKFKLNSITLEAFILASKRLNDALVKRVSLMRDVNVSRYQLETLIGMPLDRAMEIIRVQ